ncbi:MAG: A24 family peptidase [Burkholderiaceae bacterium]|nr:A24 family peptidase [Burkholderiaceae bacterium]
MQGLSVFAESAPLAIGSALLLGVLIGSFLNVVIARLPRMMELEWQDQADELRGDAPAERERFNLVTPRSRCPDCGHAIGALENIPILSWVVLRGRCSSCGKAISARYPIVEALSGALCALAVWRYGASAAGVAAMVLSLYLIALTFIDLDTQLLPDSMTIPLLWLGLGLNLWGVFATLQSAVIGAIAGYLLLWSVYWLFRIATGKEGMGYGDFKLLAALGAWFGWQLLPAIILLASVVGATVGIALILFRRHGRDVPIPFGPYLAGAGLLALYLGKPLSGLFGLA